MLSRLVITFLPRTKRLLISWLQSPSAVILEPPKIVCHCFHCFPIYTEGSVTPPSVPFITVTRCCFLWVLSIHFHTYSPWPFLSGVVVPGPPGSEMEAAMTAPARLWLISRLEHTCLSLCLPSSSLLKCTAPCFLFLSAFRMYGKSKRKLKFPYVK